MPFRLFDLPEELIISIAEEIEDTETLRCVARTCKRLQPLAEARLYRHIFCRTGTQLKALFRAQQTPDRTKYIRSLEVRCKFGTFERQSEKDRSALTSLSAILLLAKNMESFVFESPYCNGNRWTVANGWDSMYYDLAVPFWQAVDNLRNGPPTKAALQNLTSLELHLNGLGGKEFYDLDNSWFPILLHPTLEDLKISSANISHDLAERFRRPLGDQPSVEFPLPKTPLKHLKLDECNITNEGLHAILSLPKALEDLYLGEQQNCADYYGRFQTALTDDPASLITALSLQSHSLTKLFHIPSSHATHSTSTKDASLTGLSTFPSLTSLALESPEAGRTSLYNLLTSPVSTPPNLQSLCLAAEPLLPLPSLYHHQDRHGTASPRLKYVDDLLASNPSLSKLSLIFPRDVIGSRVHPDVKGVLDIAAAACVAARVELTVFRRASRTWVVAPLLFGESIEAPMLVYSGEGGWRVGVWEEGERGGGGGVSGSSSSSSSSEEEEEEGVEDWEDAEGVGWVDEEGDEVDGDDGDWEDDGQQLDDDGEEVWMGVGENDDWWVAS